MGFTTLLHQMSAIGPRVVSHKCWHSDGCNAGTFSSIRQDAELIILPFYITCICIIMLFQWGFTTLLHQMSAIGPRVVCHKCWHSDGCNAGTFSSIRQHAELIILPFYITCTCIIMLFQWGSQHYCTKCQRLAPEWSPTSAGTPTGATLALLAQSDNMQN